VSRPLNSLAPLKEGVQPIKVSIKPPKDNGAGAEALWRFLLEEEVEHQDGDGVDDVN
jgi:hypothetical protein